MKGSKMISAVNSCNPVVQNKSIQFKGEQIPVKSSKGMSTTTEALVGLGALASITAGILLAKKRIDANEIKNLSKEVLPSADDLMKSAKNLEMLNCRTTGRIAETFLPDLRAGDKLILVPPCRYAELSKVIGVDYTALPKNSILAYVVRGSESTAPKLFTYEKIVDNCPTKMLNAFEDGNIHTVFYK